MNTLAESMKEIAKNAKIAARKMVSLSAEQKNKALEEIAHALNTNREQIQAINKKDLDAAEKQGLSSAMLDRLRLSDKVIDSMIDGVLQVVALPDPIGKISDSSLQTKGIRVGRMSIPLGVVCMIYEARPNVTVDAAVLCLKTGNAVILRGGSEAFHSNMVLAQILQDALKKVGVAKEMIQVVPSTDREAIGTLLLQDDSIDLVIPRGGEGLIRYVVETSRIPVLKHYKGVCHIFVDKDADLEKATPIILNAKTQRPGVCNALEGLLIHEQIADSYMPHLLKSLFAKGVKVFGCSRAENYSKDIVAAQNSDWGTEFLDLALCLKIVSSFDEARDYIEQYGSHHTECILTENYSLANRFVREIDASAVIVNASTRFNDGGQLGLGAEIGISTSKLHAYGPMGLEELTSKKFVVYGEGQYRD